MKILQSTIRYYPALGGVEEYVKNICEGLVARDHKVDVFTSDIESFGNLVKMGSELKEDEVNGVKILRFESLPLMFRGYAVMPSMFFKIYKEDFDVIHGHGFMYFNADCASVVSKLRKKPFVFNPYLTDLGPPSVFGKLYRNTLGKAAMSADVVVLISEYEKKVLERWGFKPKRIEVVCPGIDHSEYENVNYNIFQDYDTEGKKVVLYVGRLDENKGIDILLRAADIVTKKCPEVIFFIVGEDFGAAAGLEKLASDLGLEEYVKFLKGMNRKDVISAYKNSDIFVLPSKHEAFGIVMLEAMAAGLPVVGNDNSAIPYLVKDGMNGFVFQRDDYEDLSEKIIKLLRDESLRKKMSSDCIEFSKQFSLANRVSKIEEIYESLVK